ncbi:MAG: glutamate cyclase domain-containing protein [Dehalococcoidia bacterium]
MSVEEIVLGHDRRGISELRGFLPADFCHAAADLVLNGTKRSRKRAIITTGFYVLSARAPETDGPPGALAIGRALKSLGFEIIYVTDEQAAPLLSCTDAQKDMVIVFPLADRDSSGRFAEQVLADVRPSLIISVERCGPTRNGQYLNMSGEDVTDYTAKVDCLFTGHGDSIGIGDGGNEIGMGNLAPHIPAVHKLPADPAITMVNRLVIATVSNWGGYGLVAALSRLTKNNLLPSIEWEKDLIIEMVSRGAVDSVSGLRRSAVDGFDLEQNSWALDQLHRVISPIS